MALIMKQARAIVDERTTVICLDIHGDIVPVDMPFETLAGDFQSPPFHVHCRTLVGPYMKGFVAQARKAANAELVKRPLKERRKGPGGPAADIPGPVTQNPPSGFTRAVEDQEMAGVDARNRAKPLFTADAARLANAGKGATGPAEDGWAPTLAELPKLPPKPISKDAAAAMIDAAYVAPSEVERTAVGLYMAGMTWSQDLRARRASEFTMERVGQVRSLIDKQAPFEETVALYRGMSRMYMPGNLEDMVGTEIKDLGLGSTSLDMEVAGLFAGTGNGVMLEILCPPGTRALSVNHARLEDMSGIPEEYRAKPQVLGGESEMILKDGYVVRVVQVTRRKVEHGFVDTLQVEVVNE